MTVIRSIAASALIASSMFAAAPAAAVITTFAGYSAIGGANMYWSRSGSDYTVAAPVVVIPVHVNPAVVKPKIIVVAGTPAQKSAAIAANASAVIKANAANGLNVAAANAANAANIAAADIQNAKNVVTAHDLTVASANAAAASAGGNLFTIAHSADTVAGAVQTHFSFVSPSALNSLTALSALGTLNAAFTFDGTSSSGNTTVSGGGFDIQKLSAGTFSFIYTGAATLHVHHALYETGAVLLSATFSNGAVAGQNHSTSGSVGASSDSAGTITYTSDFLDFGLAKVQDFSISAGSITAALGFTDHQSLNPFKTTTGGLFSSGPQPKILSLVPEPATWLLLIAGFGLVGFQVRRRAGSVSVAA